MVIFRIATQIARALAKTSSADIRVLRKAGWKPAAAKGISHGLFAGSSVNYIKSDDELDDDGAFQKRRANKARPFNKTYRRLKRYTNCRNHTPYKVNRYR